MNILLHSFILLNVGELIFKFPSIFGFATMWFCFKIRFRFIYQCTYISEISLWMIDPLNLVHSFSGFQQDKEILFTLPTGNQQSNWSGIDSDFNWLRHPHVSRSNVCNVLFWRQMLLIVWGSRLKHARDNLLKLWQGKSKFIHWSLIYFTLS